MAEQQQQVLQMLQDGKLTAEEAARLLEALEGPATGAPRAEPARRTAGAEGARGGGNPRRAGAPAAFVALLARCELSGTNLASAKLDGADLADANLSGANLEGADLTGTKLAHANLSGTNLEGVDLSGLDLSGRNLSGASLEGLDLLRMAPPEPPRPPDAASSPSAGPAIARLTLPQQGEPA